MLFQLRGRCAAKFLCSVAVSIFGSLSTWAGEDHAGDDQFWRGVASILPAANPSPAPAGPSSTNGQWSAVRAWPHVPVSAAVLPNGKLLTFSGQENKNWPGTATRTRWTLYDAAGDSFANQTYNDHEMFCAALVMRADGKLQTTGGRYTVRDSSLYDWRTNQWSRVQDMAGRRWYNTSVAMPDGKVLAFSGTGSQNAVEEFDDVTASWRILGGMNWTPIGSLKKNWPHVMVAPDGRLFHFGHTETMHWVDSAGNGSLQSTTLNVPGAKDGEEAGFVMYDIGKVLVPGGYTSSTDRNASEEAYLVNFNVDPVEVRSLPGGMQEARQFANCVVLPNGEVLILGGNSQGRKFTDIGGMNSVELWNPVTEQFRQVAPMSVPRGYHSTALLLPDGRVFCGGSGYGGAGTELWNKDSAEFYTPPILFNADGTAKSRPVLTSAPEVVSCGSVFTVDGTAGLAEFAAIRLQSTTHAMNTDQRRITLPFAEVAAGEYQIIAHPNPNVMIPGYWMLFGLKADGAYSAAKMIKVDEDLAVAGAGLKGDYYDGIGLSDFKFSRLGENIDFSWGAGSPDAALVGVDTFSVRWSGYVVPTKTETYTFFPTTDDGVRLWVGGQQLVNQWVLQAPTETSGSISLQAGVPVPIVMEFYENAGGAAAQLRWSSASTPKSIIPVESLLQALPGAAVDSASVAVDEVHELYVDGQLVGIGTNVDQVYNTALSAGGASTIAIRACKVDGSGFAVGDFTIGGERYATGSEWKVSTVAPVGWNQVGFDDDSWASATDHGALAAGLIGEMPVGSVARQIWAADPLVDEVFLRFEISPIQVDAIANRADRPNEAVSFQVGASGTAGATLSFSATGLPGGISINAGTGVISGTLSGQGGFSPVVTVADGAGNSRSVTFVWSVNNTGSLLREWWTGVGGGAVADLQSDPRFPDSPTGSAAVSSFPVAVNSGNNYGSRLRGYVHPPVSGSYRFWIASDDGGSLRLGSGSDPASAVEIASVPGANWTGQAEWNKFPQQRSALINLQAGQSYYLEVLHKELGSGDHINLAWQVPGAGGLSVMPLSSVSPFVVNRAPVLGSLPDRAHSVGSGVFTTIPASDADGDVLFFSAIGLPPGLTLNSASGVVSGSPTQAGSYNVTVSVSDLAATSSASFVWTVNGELQLTAVSGGVIQSGVSAQFTATASGGTGVSFVWNFGDGTSDTSSSSSATANHSFASPGRYLVTVTGTDANGTTATAKFTQPVRGALTANRAVASSGIVTVGSGAGLQVWNVNPDNDSVSIFNGRTGAKLGEVAVGAEPRSLAQAPDGDVWVANKGAATVSVLSASSFAVLQTIALPINSAPHGLAFSPAGGEGYVVLEGRGELLKLNPNTAAVLATLAVGDAPRHLSINADGSRVYVSRFMTPLVAGEATVNPSTSAGGGEIVEIDASGMAVVKTIVLAQSVESDFGGGGRGLPNYLGAMAISPDGSAGWVPSKLDNIHRGVLRDGSNLNHQNSVRSITSRVVLGAGVEDFSARIDHDDSGVPTAAVYGPNGLLVFVALEGSREVAVIDAFGKNELFRLDVGRAPQGVAISDDGTVLFVHNFLSRSVSAFDVSGLVGLGLTDVPSRGTFGAVASEVLTPQVLLGKQLFYDSRDDRMAHENYMSCASCHNDGGHDGRVWDLSGFGEGLRNTIDLRGRGGMAHGPLHWSANFDEVQDFEGQIRSLSGGDGLIANGNPHPSLGAPNAGRSVDLDALAAYVASLAETAGSPARAADGTLTADAALGREVFRANNCASCHSGSSFTDSAPGNLHDIGTLKPSSGSRLGGLLTGIDTPTLRGLWDGAPFLHDGSAPNLGSAVDAHAGVVLSAVERDQLVAYLMQIDPSELSAPEAGGHTPDADTIALYHFTSDFADASANTLDLTVAGTVQIVSGAASFDALGDSLSVSIPDALVLREDGLPLTLEARIKPRAWLGYQQGSYPVIALEQEWNAHFLVEDQQWTQSPIVQSSSGSLLSGADFSAAVTLGEWHTLRISYDGDDSVSVSVDGTLLRTANLPPDRDRISPWLLTLGNFDGELDEVYLTRSIIADGPDVTAPALELTTASATVGGAFQVSVAVDEVVTGLTLSDFVVSNGNLSGLTGVGSSYSVTVTPVALGAVTIQLAGSAVMDAAGNASAASNVLAVTYDDAPPSGDDYTPDADTVALYHFAGNFEDASANGLDLTAAGGVQIVDGAARFGALGSQLTVSIPDSLVLPASGQPLTIDARIRPRAWLGYAVDSAPIISLEQEWNSNFVLGDQKWGNNPRGPVVQSSGGSLLTAQQFANAIALDDWNDLRISYDGADTVTVSIEGVVINSVQLAPDSGRLNDWVLTLGNFDGDLDEVYITRSVIVDGPDTTPPVVALSTISATVDGSFRVDLTADEVVGGLAIGDVVVGNGVASGLGGGGSGYYFDVAPSAVGAVTVQLAAGAVADAAGNVSAASNTLTVTYDDTPPPVGDDEFVPDANTVALYHMNLNFNDTTANGFHLSAAGNVQLVGDNLGWMQSPGGKVARFSGAGDTLSVSIPDSELLVAGDSRPLTIEARIYPRSWSGYGLDDLPIVSLVQEWDTGFELHDLKWGSNPRGPRVASAGIPIANAADWAGAVPMNAWAKLQISFDGAGAVKVLVNSVELGSVLINPNIDRNNPWQLVLGNFDGDLDEVVVHRGVAPQGLTVGRTPVGRIAALMSEAIGGTGPTALLDTDIDGDGWSAMLELALGTDPASSADVPDIDLSFESDGRGVVRFGVPVGAQATANGFETAAFEYRVEVSLNLVDWQSLEIEHMGSQEIGDGFRSVTVRASGSADSRPPFGFYRVTVLAR